VGTAARIGLAAAAVVVAVVLFLVLRDDDGDEAAPTTAAATTETGSGTETGPGTETGTTTAPSPPPSPPPAPERRQLRVNVPAGGPTRIARLDVEQGEDVVLVVRSAVADEVHLHGYDLSADVAPGRVARIRFTADQPGRFEIELEQAHEGIAQLRVTP
jgi:hypothetical protein